MDNPGMSIFKNCNFEINTGENEEAEDEEERRLHEEEVQKIMAEKLGDFSYEDSVNSSIISLDQNAKYEEANFPDQYKILYETKLQELGSIRDEFENYKTEQQKEFEALKRKLTLSEAEIRHLQDSLSTSQSLIEEKIDALKYLEKVQQSNEAEIQKYQTEMEQLRYDIGVYKSTINELQMKLNDNNPFSMEAHKLNFEEIQKTNHDRILKLETLLEQQQQKTEKLAKDKLGLQEELRRLSELKNEESSDKNTAVNYLTANLQGAQNQCHELLEIVESLTTENTHLRERVRNVDLPSLNQISFKGKNRDKELILQLEKLTKVINDQEMELKVLKSKSRFYENDVKELLEYRDMKNCVYTYDFNACGDSADIQKILVLQNELKASKELLKEKEAKIQNLEHMNRRLQDEIEKMLQKTRHEIHSISEKYHLPQLEKMNKELKLAEEKNRIVEEKLAESEALRKDLESNLQSREKENDEINIRLTENEKRIEVFKKLIDDEKSSRDEVLRETHNKLKEYQDQITNLERLNKELTEQSDTAKTENNNLRASLEETSQKFAKAENLLASSPETLNCITLKLENDHLKNRLREALTQLQRIHESKNDEQDNDEFKQLFSEYREIKTKVKGLEDTIAELGDAKLTLEAEKMTLENQLMECESQLQSIREEKENKTSKKSEEEIEKLKKMLRDTTAQLNAINQEAENLKKEIDNKETIIHSKEDENRDLQEKLIKSQHIIEEYELKNANQDEQKIAKNLTQVRQDFADRELKLRKDLQQKLVEASKKIEEEYTEVVMDLKKTHEKELKELKKNEKEWRNRFISLIEKCEREISEVKNQNFELNNSVSILRKERDDILEAFQHYRSNNDVDSYKKNIQPVLTNLVQINKTYDKSREKVLAIIDQGNRDYAAVEKAFDDRIALLNSNVKKK